MGFRRISREYAMQALFFMDRRRDNSDKNLADFQRSCPPPQKALPFFNRLVRGVMGMQPVIDTIVERFSDNWKISRMSCVDRNVLRIAVFEMCLCDDIPIKVSINEAIDVGKKYGTKESGAFINGILDSVHLAIENQTLNRELTDIKTRFEAEVAGEYTAEAYYDATESDETPRADKDDAGEKSVAAATDSRSIRLGRELLKRTRTQRSVDNNEVP
jgi:N utilization substance protein B